MAEVDDDYWDLGAVTLVDMLVDVVVYYADSQQCHTVSR